MTKKRNMVFKQILPNSTMTNKWRYCYLCRYRYRYPSWYRSSILAPSPAPSWYRSLEVPAKKLHEVGLDEEQGWRNG